MSDFFDALYVQSELQQLSDISARVEYISRFLLGKPYLVNPQGEGVDSAFDSAPLYRFDGFDCVTFVNNVLALALSHDEQSFKKNLLKINYHHATPLYENRFHFMSADWNIQNQKNKVVQDITTKIIDKKNNVIAEYAEGDIDRPSWFLKKTDDETPERADYLRQAALNVKKEFVRLSYLPLSKLFDDHKNPNKFLFNQIPHGSIVEIVRPNWNLKDKIGTNLHVSHVGFAIRQSSGELLFRHASSEKNSVVEMILSDYLKNMLGSSTIKGINVQVAL